jgi:hypothetical protein
MLPTGDGAPFALEFPSLLIETLLFSPRRLSCLVLKSRQLLPGGLIALYDLALEFCKFFPRGRIGLDQCLRRVGDTIGLLGNDAVLVGLPIEALAAVLDQPFIVVAAPHRHQN